MRELKFRARAKVIYNWSGYNKASRVNEGDWVVGHYFTEPASNEDSCSFYFVPHIRMPHGEHSTDIEIDPDTLGQYTGLTDKNGVEIYEGDIVECNNGHKGIVEWEDHDACFNVAGYYDSSNDYPSMAFMEGQPFTIIGNIHENPELLGDNNEN